MDIYHGCLNLSIPVFDLSILILGLQKQRRSFCAWKSCDCTGCPSPVNCFARLRVKIFKFQLPTSGVAR